MNSGKNDKVTENQLSYRLICRFPFAPALQRASVLVQSMDSGNLTSSNVEGEYIVFTKGAPEIISRLSVPISGIPKL